MYYYRKQSFQMNSLRFCAPPDLDIIIRRSFEKFVDSPYYSVYVFEKRVERCKKYIACQGRHLEKDTITVPPHSSYSE
jgi:hypothetical protein